MTLRLRPGRDADADFVIALIGAAWREYPGIILDVDGEEPELRALASAFAARGGMFWIAEAADGTPLGMAGVRRAGPPWTLADAWEIARVYVSPAARGSGVAQALMAQAEAHAIAAGARHLVLHTDTRFRRAHRFYAQAGYVRHGPIKVLHDRSQSLEYPCAKPVDGAWALDAAAAASAEAGLAALLGAAAREAAVAELPADAERTACAAYAASLARAVARDVGGLVLGWRGGVLAGFAAYALPGAPPMAHRMDLSALFVTAALRRRGLGREMIAAAFAAARSAGRGAMLAMLIDQAAVRGFAAALGWREAGRIEAYARLGGQARAALIATAALTGEG